MIFAGYLKKRPIEMVKCVTSDIKVPAHAEFILEGYVDLNELRREGPFGDHTGYYSLEDDYPVFHLEKITRKKKPVYPTTIVGKPPMEDCYLGKATERIFLPLMKIQVPEIVDIDFPLEGVFHNCVIVSMKKAYPMQANKLMYALWGLGQMMYTKMIIVVDAEVDVHDYKAVIQALAQNATCESCYTITEGPLDALDHASNRAFQGFRLGIDATSGLSLECKTEGFDLSFESIQSGLKHGVLGAQVRIENFEKDKGIRAGAYMLDKMASEPQLRFLILVDDWIDISCLSTVSWKIFNNIDPKRDMIIETREDGRLFVGIDATKKGIEDGLMRPWPDDIVMSDDIKEKVDKRWSAYGIRD
jgi:4-hydroxy-3-polyprenylbenzoate decarboxylase